MNIENVSIVTPIRNGIAFAKEYASTIAGLSPCPREIILVDDHSEDRSPDVIKSLLDHEGVHRVTIHHARGCGVANARNEGLRLVSTPYTALLDVDDSWPTARFEGFMPYLKKSGTQLLHSSFMVSRDGLPLYEGATRLASGSKGYRNLLRGTHSIGGSASGAILHTESALSIGGFRETLDYGEDYEFWLRYVMHFGVILVDADPVLINRTGGTQPLDNVHRCQFDFRRKTLILQNHLSVEYSSGASFRVRESAWCHRWMLFITLTLASFRQRAGRQGKECKLPTLVGEAESRPGRVLLLVSFLDAVFRLSIGKLQGWRLRNPA